MGTNKGPLATHGAGWLSRDSDFVDGDDDMSHGACIIILETD